jgi:chromatin remodeling complex protein RSC6
MTFKKSEDEKQYKDEMKDDNYYKMAPKKVMKSKSVEDKVIVPPQEVALPPVEEQPLDASDIKQKEYSVLLEKLAMFTAELKSMQLIVKTLQKEHSKLVSSSTKKSVKKTNTKRVPSGFQKPTLLSDAMCEFLKVEKGREMPRVDVTKMINEYIRKNELQDPNDKRNIVLDNELKKIISIENGQKLTYFNLQSFIKHHFIKTA